MRLERLEFNHIGAFLWIQEREAASTFHSDWASAEHIASFIDGGFEEHPRLTSELGIAHVRVILHLTERIFVSGHPVDNYELVHWSEAVLDHRLQPYSNPAFDHSGDNPTAGVLAPIASTEADRDLIRFKIEAFDLNLTSESSSK